MFLPILNATIMPSDSSGNAVPGPATLYGFSNHKGGVFAFLDGGTGSIRGTFKVPKTPASSTLRIVWGGNATSGSVKWQFAYKALPVDGSVSADVNLSTGADQTATVTSASTATADSSIEATISLTNTNFVAGKLIEFEFSRLGSDAADTFAQTACLFALGYDDGN